MIKLDTRTPLSRVELIQTQQNISSPNKRNIKISNQKFPVDFFKDTKDLRQSRQARDSRNRRDSKEWRNSRQSRQFKEPFQKNLIFQSMSKMPSDVRQTSSRNLPQTHQQVRQSNYNNIHIQNKLNQKLNNIDQLNDIKRRQMSTALDYRAGVSVGLGSYSAGISDLQSRQLFNYEQDLIKSVLSSARQMKKMIRKHSIQLKKDREYNNLNINIITNNSNTHSNIISNMISGRQIVNNSSVGPISTNKQQVQLPPLRLKRGFTTAF